MKETVKILVVDDEPHIRLLIEQTLEDLENLEKDIELLFANNGEEGLRLIQKHKPQLVFLDVMMPKMNGFDVCFNTKYKLGLYGVYIVMLTAKGQEFDRQKSIGVGANMYVTKPFDPEEVYEIARKYIVNI